MPSAAARVLGHLLELSTALGAAMTPDQAAEIVTRAMRDALGAGATFVWLDDGDDLVLATHVGYRGPGLDSFRRFGLDAGLPVSDAIAQSRPVLITSRADRLRRYPHLGDGSNAEFHAWAAVPLLIERRAVGVVLLSFLAEREFDADDLSLMMAMSAQSAQVIERTRLLVTERKARERATASEARLQAFFDSSQSVIYLKDLEGRYLAVNLECERVVGRPRAQLIGKTDRDLVDADTAALWAADDRQVAATGEPIQRELSFVFGGRQLNSLTTKFPLRDADGTVYAVGGISTDITARLESERGLRERDAQLGTLYRLGARFARELDHDKLVQLITDEATELTGAEFGAFFFNKVTPDGDVYMLSTIAGPLRGRFAGMRPPRATPIFGPTFRGEATVRLDDVTGDPRFGQWGPQPPGHPPVASYLAVPVVTRAGEVLGGLFFGHHQPARFTEQHERMVDGIAAQATVALENARLYGAIRDSEARARLAEQRKDEFLAVLGHELRNPLAPIVTALELMKLRGGAFVKEREVIGRQVQHLSRLVDDLLDVSRITSGKIELTRQVIEIAPVIADAIEIASPLIEGRSHSLSLEVPSSGLPVEIDPTRMAQVIANLLTNAAKYTDPGGHIVVSATREGDQVVVRVADDGVGIRPELLPRIFDHFVQGDQSIDRAAGGLGLGLALVHSIVRLHGGTVEARSDGPGLGSELVVRLARSTVAAPVRIASSTGPATALTGRRILVVDDNTDAADAMAELLLDVGHQVAVAFDGPSALDVAARFRPDIALLDIGLPVMDGYELAPRMRTLLGDAPLRLVALTGYGQDSDRQRAREAGFDDHMVKPVDLRRLQALLAEPLPAAR